MELYDYIQMPKSLPPLPGADMGQSYQDRYYYNSPNDSRLWLELFSITSKHSHDLTQQIEIIRATGAWLIMDQQYGFKIQPVIGVNGWESMEQYQQERQLLIPHSSVLIQSLGELRRRCDSGKTF